jgi:beta-glucosidase
MRYPRCASALLWIFGCGLIVRADPPVYQNPSASVEARVADALPRLTLDEKLSLLGGDREFYIRPIPRLGLPEIKMADGPLGVRNYGPAPTYPATIDLAASWDTALARRFGASIGRDARARGVNIMLGPAININRLPMNGRNFEYLTEDPFLAGRFAVAIVKGMQSQGIVATVKHYAANNQETERNTINEIVDERALREIYLPAFRAAVEEGHAWAVMDAYNRLNGSYCTASGWLNNAILKYEWHFPGAVMSDWGAVHETLGVVNGGMDLEMPSGVFLNAGTIKPLLDSGAVTLATIDDKVRRILRLEIANGFLDRPQLIATIPKDDPRSAATALQIAREGTVLLKNEGHLLPFDRRRIKSIVVIGPNADTFVAGGGSSHASPVHFINLIDGLRRIAGPGVDIEQVPRPTAAFDRLLGQTRYATPLKFEFLVGDWRHRQHAASGEESGIDHDWNGRPPAAGVSPGDYFVTWSGSIRAPATGRYLFLLRGVGGSEVRLGDLKIMGTWGNPENLTLSAFAPLEAGKTYRLQVSYDHHQGDPSAVHFAWGAAPETFSAADAASVRAADAVIVAAGFNMMREGEGADRTYDLPDDQAELIRQVAAANPRTAVVLDAGGSVATAGWIGQTPAVLQAWYPGQEGGQALAEILFGDVDPSGKLPISYEKRWEDSAAYGNYPGAGGKVTYREGIFVGYRWFDFKNVAPLFPFGFGLSYTTFRYDHLRIDSDKAGTCSVTFDVTNTGSRAGDEVAQVYVSPPPASLVQRPPRELKGFARLSLNPGETKTATVTLDRNAFAYFSEAKKAWTVDPGAYGIAVSASSRDPRLTGSIDVP